METEPISVSRGDSKFQTLTQYTITMPHKHKRDRSKNGPAYVLLLSPVYYVQMAKLNLTLQRYDLPPTTIAKPLLVLKTSNANEAKKSNPIESSRHVRKKSRTLKREDDTPRAFTRLMNFQDVWKQPNGLDNGPASKKRKCSNTHNLDQSLDHKNDGIPSSSIPKILPSERLSEFSARVNAAIPVAGLAKKSKRNSEILAGERQTKMEKRMQKMYAEWREAEAKRKEQLAEEDDELEMERDEVGKESSRFSASTKTKRKSKRKRRKGSMMNDGAEDPDDDDPWSHITAKRKETPIASASPGGLVGLHDVVLGPPKLTKLPKEKMREKTGQNALKKAAIIGLKRQTELEEARIQVVEGYRRMMSERRGEQ